MLIIGHRGVAAHRPENTLSSFEYAAELGLEWVELDIQLSGDAVPVVIHDRLLTRTAGQRARVNDLDWYELRKLDAGSWFDPQYAQQHVPSLAQVLDLCAQHGMKANIEIKVYSGDDLTTICQNLMEVIFASKLPREHILLSSFSHPMMMLVHQILPGIHLAQNFESLAHDWIEELTVIDAYSVHCDADLLTQEQAQAIKAAGYRLGCFTVNDADKAQQLAEWGVDMLFTDDPAALHALAQ